MADAQQAAAKDARGLSRKDLALASRVVSEGRALLILLNKLDALPQAAAARVRACPVMPHAHCCTACMGQLGYPSPTMLRALHLLFCCSCVCSLECHAGHTGWHHPMQHYSLLCHAAVCGCMHN